MKFLRIIGFIISLAIFAMVVLSNVGCSSQRYIDEGVKGIKLKEGETHCQLKKVSPTIKGGHKYLFVTEKKDTLIKEYPGKVWFEVGKWYCVKN